LVSTIGAGTVRYWPPERFFADRRKYDMRSDIWSFGLTLAEVAYGKYPIFQADGTDIDFKCIDFISLQSRIREAKGDEIVENCIKDKYSDELCEFIWLCLQKMNERATIEELKEADLYEKYQVWNKNWIAKLMKQA
jgi:mitogen-activated protein kinase kinase